MRHWKNVQKLKLIQKIMSQFQIDPITSANVEAVVYLLLERSGTIPSYTRWKYGQHRDSLFRGVVASLNGEPVGCFGLVARSLLQGDGREIPCGWFADWYVTSGMRSSGLGTEMLRRISQAYPVVLGHPGPEKARSVCLANGYQPLGFQSRRRLILRRYDYERTRTRFFLKAAAKVFAGLRQSGNARRYAHAFPKNADTNTISDAPAARFTNVEKHREWILAQPAEPTVSRKIANWARGSLEVVSFDDQVPSAGLRRRVLYTSGTQQYSQDAWRAFLRDARETGCVYVELFTTDVQLDNTWALLGACPYPDARVLVRGEPSLTANILLHGWDRENWTFLADRSGEGKHSPIRTTSSAVPFSPGVRGNERVSVIIPTYKRRAHLQKVLGQLALQTRQPSEVIVADASPAADRPYEKAISGYPSWLRYLVVPESGNISKQRNTGLQRATGDIVLFLDDDVEFGPDLIAAYLDAFRETHAAGINGMVLLPNEKRSTAPKFLNPLAIQYPGAPNYQAFDGVCETDVICTASFAAARRALLEVGGFDQQIHGSLDDVDLGIRMREAGFRVIHHNKPEVLHLMLRVNGSRSPELGLRWTLANLFYFQFRHFWRRYRLVLLARTLWDYCRPSRLWLTPGVVKSRCFAVLQGYREALRRMSEGPQFLAGAEANEANRQTSRAAS
jgi:GT2 family glycosyltransferase